jgi:hypothetical protein
VYTSQTACDSADDRLTLPRVEISVRLGIPELLILLPLLLPVGFVVGFVRRAKRLGYPSVGAYLRAVPRTDVEKHDAVNLAMKGLVVALLGVLFAPIVLIGLVPLFYGGRKVAYASLGLGLVDDADHTGR